MARPRKFFLFFSIGLLCCLPRAPLRLAQCPHPPEKSNSWNCGNADYNSRDQVIFAGSKSRGAISVPHPRRAMKRYLKDFSILFGTISIHFQPPGATLGCFPVLGKQPRARGARGRRSPEGAEPHRRRGGGGRPLHKGSPDGPRWTNQ